MESNGIESLFAKAADSDKFLTEGENQTEVIRKLRRGLLGLGRLKSAKTFGEGRQILSSWLRQKSVKTLDEMGQILYDVGMVSSVEEGREITPSLMVGSIGYGFGFANILDLEEVKNGKGDTRYLIQYCHYNPEL